MLHIVDNAAALDKVQQMGAPFAVLVTGPAGDIVPRILVRALRAGLPLDHVAAMSWNHGAVLRSTIRTTVAKAQGYPPDFSIDEMIAGAEADLIGSVYEVLQNHSWDSRPALMAEHRRAVIAEYLELIQRITGDAEADRPFLHAVRRQIETAIRLSIKSRLDECRLVDAYRAAIVAGKRMPALSFVTEVADYFRDYKQQCGLADLPDQLAAKLTAVPACELALIEDAGAIPALGLRALRRLLPEASFVLAGLESEDATQPARKIFGTAK